MRQSRFYQKVGQSTPRAAYSRKARTFTFLGPLAVPRNAHPRKAFAFGGGPSHVRKVGGSMVLGEPA